MMPPALAIRWLWAALAAILGTTVLFIMAPGLDIAVSRMFGDETGFPVAASPLWNGVRDIFRRSSDAAAIAVLALAILGTLGLRLWGLAPRKLWFYALSYLAVPGVFTNWILKANSGRARPRNVTEFGGDKMFTQPWHLADQCPVNCSFVSGEASAFAATAILLTLLLWTRLSRSWLVLIWGVATFGSLLRVAFGGHFLSDVMLAMGLTVALITGAYLVTGMARRSDT